MYKSFKVKNFRCFRDMNVEPLERLNLFAGKNNIGKTALLEALWIHQGANVPDLARRVNAFRGLDQVDTKELLWELFLGLDPSLTIELSASGTWNANPRVLRIHLQERPSVETPIRELISGKQDTQEVASATVRTSRDEIVFHYTDESNTTFESRGWAIEHQIGPNLWELGFQSQQASIGKRSLGVYLSARYRGGLMEDISRFGNLEVVGKEQELVQILSHVDSRIKRLSVIVRAGVPVFHADIGVGRLLPVPLLGDGMARLLSLALAIGNAEGGIVLVDEIENGLYHGVMVDVWKAIATFARQFDVQIFATTHSYECIRAAHQAFEEDSQYDFHLHRLERVQDDIRVVTYNKDTLGAALESGLETR